VPTQPHVPFRFRASSGAVGAVVVAAEHVDDTLCVVQPYLPDARGIDSPTLVMRRDTNPVGLFDTFHHVFKALWDRARDPPT
jgi:hypothetical protein